MQTLILLILSSFVIIGIVALYLHMAGFSRLGRIADTQMGLQAVKDKLQNAHPNSAVTELTLSPSRTVALAKFTDGSAGVLYAMGHNWIVHLLKANSLRSINTVQDKKKGTGLHLKFNDYTAPNLKIYLSDVHETQIWRDGLLPFLQPLSRVEL